MHCFPITIFVVVVVLLGSCIDMVQGGAKCSLNELLTKHCDQSIIEPVCAVLLPFYFQKSLRKVTMNSRCEACRLVSIKSVVEGSCSEYHDDATFCVPSNASDCSDVITEVCGYFDKTVDCGISPCKWTFRNQCFACSNPHLLYYLPSSCGL